MPKILVVDDDSQLRQSFEKILKSEGYDVIAASCGEDGVELVKKEGPDAVVMDVRMPGISGLEAYKLMRETDPKVQVVIMTAYGTTETAIEATKMGAFDYVLKPFDIPDILELIKKAVEASAFMRSKVDVDASPALAGGEALVGYSRVMQDLYKSIGRVAPTDATVLVRGESGTGKELVAKAVYQHSLRSENPFVVINCVAIPDTLLESELFGYEKGAFTGASGRRVGKIEQAHGGTVFLDEIGDMPLPVQAKILRLLQDRRIERLGGREAIDVDVRIIAATNRDLELAVEQGEFREDLYYRLKVVTLKIPPLRDRKEDIPVLTDYFTQKFAREMDTANPGVSKECAKILLEMDWPGNVRELSNTVQKALIFNRGLPLGPEDLRLATVAESRECYSGEGVARMLDQWVEQELTCKGGKEAFDSIMDTVGKTVITKALEITEGNRTKAAKLLGMSRPTLISRIDKLKINIKARIS